MIAPSTDKAVYCRVHQVLFFDAGTTEFTTDERCQMALSTPVILVIADISGYTHFMRMHSVVSSHAKRDHSKASEVRDRLVRLSR